MILIRGPPESSRTECPGEYHQSHAITITNRLIFRGKYAIL